MYLWDKDMIIYCYKHNQFNTLTKIQQQFIQGLRRRMDNPDAWLTVNQRDTLTTIVEDINDG